MKGLVVGLGSIGIRHLNNLYQLGVTELAALRVRNLSPPTEVKVPQLQIFTDFQEALSQGFDFVVIANPTSLHLPYAQTAVEAGCHVYLEKPVSHTWDGIEKLQQAQGQAEIFVGYQMRYHPHLKQIKTWLDDGKIGEIQNVHADLGTHLPSWHPWEDYKKSYAARRDLGGGVILTMIHEIDLLYWFLGRPQSLSATGGRLTPLGIDAEDTAHIQMNYPKDNLQARLTMDYWRNPEVRNIFIHGTQGSIHWDSPTGKTVLKREKEEPLELQLSSEWDRNDLFLDIMKDFLAVIRREKENPLPLSEGLESLQIALQAKAEIDPHL